MVRRGEAKCDSVTQLGGSEVNRAYYHLARVYHLFPLFSRVSALGYRLPMKDAARHNTFSARLPNHLASSGVMTE